MSATTEPDIQQFLERFRRGGEILATTTTGAAGAELDFKAAPEKWSVRQIVCHLADSEMYAAMRFRRVIAESNPTIEWYDEQAWAENLDYGRRKISQGVETFRNARGETYELIKGLPAEAWSRPYVHSRYGPNTLGGLLKIYTEHLENHVTQIRAARDAYKASKK